MIGSEKELIGVMPLASDVPDEELIQKIASGDRDSFETLYRRYQSRLFRHILRIVGDRPTAEGLTNDVLVEVWKTAGKFRGRSRASTWMFSIAHHKALSALRGRGRAGAHEELSEELPDPAETPDRHIVQGDIRTRMREALRTLSASHREALDLIFYEGLSYEEIATIVGCPSNTVKTRVFHAKRRLREILERRGLAGGAA